VVNRCPRPTLYGNGNRQRGPGTRDRVGTEGTCDRLSAASAPGTGRHGPPRCANLRTRPPTGGEVGTAPTSESLLAMCAPRYRGPAGGQPAQRVDAGRTRRREGRRCPAWARFPDGLLVGTSYRLPSAVRPRLSRLNVIITHRDALGQDTPLLRHEATATAPSTPWCGRLRAHACPLYFHRRRELSWLVSGDISARGNVPSSEGRGPRRRQTTPHARSVPCSGSSDQRPSAPASRRST